MAFDWQSNIFRSFMDQVYQSKYPGDNCCTSNRTTSKEYTYEIKILLDGKNERVCTEKASSKALAELFFRDSMRAEAVPEDCRKWDYYEIVSITRKE